MRKSDHKATWAVVVLAMTIVLAAGCWLVFTVAKGVEGRGANAENDCRIPLSSETALKCQKMMQDR